MQSLDSERVVCKVFIRVGLSVVLGIFLFLSSCQLNGCQLPVKCGDPAAGRVCMFFFSLLFYQMEHNECALIFVSIWFVLCELSWRGLDRFGDGTGERLLDQFFS